MQRRISARPAMALFALAAGAALVLGAGPAAADSAPANVTVNGGTLAFNSVAAVTLAPVTLNGLDQSTFGTENFGVNDATGSGSGWHVTGTSTTFTDPSTTKTLPTTATSVSQTATAVCATGVTCTPATLTTNTVTLPAGATAPTEVSLISAAANTGMGAQNLAQRFDLAIPANTYAGAYASTWTFSLVSAP